jgi:tetratricopeptide (TPR) repeat protein
VEVEQASVAVAHASDGAALYRNRLAPVVAVVALAAVGAAVWQFGFHARHEPEPDAVAQDLYIHARQSMDQHTEASLRSSIETLGRAVQRAPRYSLAWAGLAEAHNILAQYGYIEPSEGMKEARKAAQKSLEISPDLAEGHVALAAVIEAYDWNWTAAEREYRRAIQLNPELPAAHLWYGMFLRDQNRLKEALPELRHAAQLDPHSAITNLNLAYGLLMDGNSEGAVEAARHACNTAPGMVTAYAILASALRSSGRKEEGKKVLAEALERSSDDAHGLSILARASVRLGDKDSARTMYDRMIEISSHRYVSPYDLGTVSLALGEQDRAVKQFEEALKQRSSGIIFLREADFAKSDLTPEFRSLIERLKALG